MTLYQAGLEVADQAEFTALAGRLARAWQSCSPGPLLVGLTGALGAGKTTWVRGMLTGLGHRGRVPSPTYTLLEHYRLDGLDVVHVDLYRVGGGARNGDASAEIESLGLRDWLARERCWVLIEWPERVAALAAGCDVRIVITARDAEARRIDITLGRGSAACLAASLRTLSESTSS